MAKPVIILANTEERYIEPLKYKFLQELGNRIELIIITDKDYFLQYFSEPREAEVLLASEDLYEGPVKRQNINGIFLLAEEEERAGAQTENLSVTRIYKYTSVEDIYNQIIYQVPAVIQRQKQEKETKVILVGSVSGGCGKTVTALGIAANLAGSGRHVLYVNAETVPGFQYYMEDKTPLSQEAVGMARGRTEGIYGRMKKYIRRNAFSYLPPFPAMGVSLAMDRSFYPVYISEAKKEQQYDFILVDTDSAMTEQNLQMISKADKVILLLGEDASADFRMDRLLRDLDCADQDKYHFLAVGNAEEYMGRKSSYKAEIFIEKKEKAVSDLAEITNLQGMQKAAFSLL